MAAPYESVYQVMYSAMMRLNDAVESLEALGGSILDNPQAFTQQSVNNAWRRLQNFLRNLGYQSLTDETLLPSVPPVVGLDPATQTYIGWDGYWDGTTLHDTPVLPQNFMSPLELWERISGTVGNMLEMDEAIHGLPSVPKLMWNRKWQWRNERIYLPGAIVPTDFRISYAKYNMDFVDNAPVAATPWFQQTIPVINCLDSLAWFICYEYAIARQDVAALAPTFKENAEDAAQLVFNRDVRRDTSVYKPSEYGKMRDKFTPAPPSGKTPAPLIE